MKYVVTLEFKVKSIDLLDVEVEADNEREAMLMAKKKYILDPNEDYMRASDFYESTLDTWNMNLTVEEKNEH